MTPGQPKAIHTRQLAVDMYDSAKSIRSYAPESHYERVAHVMHSATLAG